MGEETGPSSLLVRREDLEGGDKVCKGKAIVSLPLLVGVEIINKDNKVVLVALVVDLCLNGFSASHFYEVL